MYPQPPMLSAWIAECPAPITSQSGMDSCCLFCSFVRLIDWFVFEFLSKACCFCKLSLSQIWFFIHSFLDSKKHGCKPLIKSWYGVIFFHLRCGDVKMLVATWKTKCQFCFWCCFFMGTGAFCFALLCFALLWLLFSSEQRELGSAYFWKHVIHVQCIFGSTCLLWTPCWDL